MKASIPAGTGEKMQFIVHPFNDNTIRFVLRYPGRLESDVLREATLALASSVEVLHASFTADSLRARWQINSLRAEDCFSCVRVQGDPAEAALQLALASIAADAPAQLRCILVQGSRDCALAVLISHLCADGVDGKYLLRKLCEAYTMLAQTGSCESLSVKNGSRAAEQVYSSLNRADRLRLLKDPRSGVHSAFPFPTPDPGRPVVLHRTLSAGEMADARGRAHAEGATVNDLLLTACYHAFAQVAGLDPQSPISIMCMMDLRRHCPGGDSQGLCNLTGALTTSLPCGPCSTFDETLRTIAAQTRRSKEDPLAGLYGMPLLHGAARKLPMGLLLAAASHLYGSMSVGLTNVGALDSASLRMDDSVPQAIWFGGPVKQKPGVQLSAVSLDGACTLCIWGCAAPADIPLLQRFLDRTADLAQLCAL